MNRTTAGRALARLATAVTAVSALGLAGAGTASADDTAFWLLPGVDTGALVGPIANAPAELLAPVHGLITVITG